MPGQAPAAGAVSMDQKVAVVTGASSGIGEAIAAELAGAGADVVAVGRDRGRLEKLAEALGDRCHPLVADVTDAGSAEAIVAAAARLGGVDILVPCAGVFEPEGIAGPDAVAALDRHYAVNVRAPFALLAAAVPHLRPGASIVLLSSICGNAGWPGASAYCASKGAIEMLTRSLARELAALDARINAIAPGIIRTPLNEAALESREHLERMQSRAPLGRIGMPEEVAPAVLFLCSEQSRFTTGATLPIDGGWLAE